MQRLLLVDDEKAICLLLRNKLSLAGFDSRICFTGEDALAALQQEPFPAAREEVVAFSGRQFDPQVVQVFASTPERDWESIRSAVARYDGSTKKLFDPLIIKAIEKQQGVQVLDDAMDT